MKKLILFTLVLCTLISCAEVPAGSLQPSIKDIPVYYNTTYRYELYDVVIREHEYIYFLGRNSSDKQLVHNPDCKKCQTKQIENNEEDLFSW